VSTGTVPNAHIDVLVSMIDDLRKLVDWWRDRRAALHQAHDASRETERITFHVEQRWIDAIRRQADLDGMTYTQIVNEAFRQYFEQK
jgi:predicted DNA binding CopG/RHH family protein